MTKPDALPVEGASIAEALEAVERIQRGMMNGVECLHMNARSIRHQTAIIRSALKRAAAEGEAWRVIEGWRDPGDRPGQTKTAAIVVGLLAEAKATPMSFVGVDRATFVEALQAAADWIKAQAPAPPKGSTR